VLVPGSGCLPLGTACTPGGFAPDLPTGVPVVYVRPGAIGGDGSSTAPYARWTDIPPTALQPNTVVAFSADRHDGLIDIPDRITLWGACPTLTVLTSTVEAATSDEAVIVATSSATIRNLSVRNAARVGITAEGTGARLFLRDVVVDRARAASVFGRLGAAVDFDRVVLRDTRLENGLFGRGLILEGSATGIVRRTQFEGHSEAALSVSGASGNLRVEDSVVRGTRPVPGSLFSWGIIAFEGAQADVRRTLVDDQVPNGVAVLGTGSSMVVTDSVLSNATGLPMIQGGGSFAGNGGELTLLRVHLADNQSGTGATGSGSLARARDVVITGTELGVLVESFGATEVSRSHIQDAPIWGAVVRMDSTLVVRDTWFRGTGRPGALALSANQSEVTLERVRVDRHPGGFDLTSTGSNVTASDLVVRGRTSDPGGGGFAIEGGRLSLRRVQFDQVPGPAVRALLGGRVEGRQVVVRGAPEDPRRTAALVAEARSEVDWTDAWVRDAGGGGLCVGRDAVLDAERIILRRSGAARVNSACDAALAVTAEGTADVRELWLADAADAAIVVEGEGGILRLSDALVADTRSRAVDGRGGRGLEVRAGGLVNLQRVWLRDHRSAGMVATDLDSVVVGQDVVVGPVRFDACQADGRCDDGAARGVAAYREADLDLERFEISAAAECGAHVARDGRIRLAFGVVADNAVGACIDVPGYDRTRIQEGVTYANDLDVSDPADRAPLDPTGF
jgi:hypothetical protein